MRIKKKILVQGQDLDLEITNRRISKIIRILGLVVELMIEKLAILITMYYNHHCSKPSQIIIIQKSYMSKPYFVKNQFALIFMQFSMKIFLYLEDL